MGRFWPVVTARGFFISPTWYAELNGRDRPEANRRHFCLHQQKTMKTIFFLICFAVSLSAIAGAGEMQTGVLKNLRGASKDLDFKLNCLRNKSYPDDIEKCGLSGFSTLYSVVEISELLD